MKKKVIGILTLLTLVICLSAALFITGCDDKDKRSWTLSADGGSIKAELKDNGKYGFILDLDGSGKLQDYSTKKDAPWYGKSGRITDIKISDGITALGANAFTDVKATSVIIPESVTAIGENCFYEQTKICAYGDVTAPDGVIVYKYSEKKPDAAGNFWHFMGEFVTVWESKATKVLFIGNSFTYYSDIPTLFSQIATAAGAEVVVESVTQGSWTLTKFADEKDEFGKQVDDKLKAANDYDAVVLQEQSTRPLNNYNDFLAAAKKLRDKIKATQTDCDIYLYSTWGYKEEADTRKITIPEMEAQLRTAYENAAQAIGAKVSYVGAAFTSVYNSHKDVNDNYCANPEKYKDSPEKGFALYFKDDNKHPSYSGAYLSACVHVATILGFNPEITSFTGELDAATAKELQKVAYQVVFGS